MNKRLVPKLRFPEFDGEWEEKKLGDIALKCLLKNKNNSIINVLTNSAKSGIVAQSDYFDRDIANPNNLEGYWVVEIDDFVYNPRIATLAPVGPINCNKLFTGVMSPLYNIFRLNDNNISKKFIQHYFSSTHWHNYMRSIANYGVRDDRMSITSDGFFGMQIFFPSLTEQKEIEKYLSAIDDKIQQLTRTKELLEQYKKGVMQQVFSQKIRFKDDNGNDYPAWEEKKLGDIVLSSKLGGNYENAEANTGIPVIKMGNIRRGKISLDKLQYLPINEVYDESDILKEGDFLFNTRNTLELVGKVAIWRNELQMAIYNSNLLRITFLPTIIGNNFFMNYLFNTQDIINKLRRYATGTTSVAAIYSRDLNQIS